MQDFSNKLNEILKGKAHQTAEVEVKQMIFSEDVVGACKMNFCGRYNKTWLCPPAVGNLEDLKLKYNKYKYVFVFTTKHNIEDSFDIEGMFDARIEHEKVESLIFQEVKDVGGKILGAGACQLCKKCTYPEAPCRFPEKAKPSVEACGIDVVTLSRTCNINYINGENTVTYFSCIFFD